MAGVNVGVDGRVLQLAFARRGIGRHLRELLAAAARGAAPPDVRFEVLCDAALDLPALDGAIAVAPLELTTVRRPDGARRDVSTALVQQKQVREAARRRGYDVFYSPTHALLPIGRFAQPHVVAVHDVIPILFWREYFTSRHPVAIAALSAVAAVRAGAVLTDSDAAARDIARVYRLPRRRIHPIPLAVEDRFRPAPAEVARAAAERYGARPPFGLYIGSFEPRKNLAALLAAIEGLRARGVLGGFTFVLAGPPERGGERVREEARRRGLEDVVRFPGFVDDADLPALYSAALFLFPSLYEGFGLPVLEAMACGTPVLALRSSSIPEVAGDAAFLVPAGDPAAFARALERLIADEGLRRELAGRGLARARLFSWERTARETIALFRRVARP